MQYFSSFSNSVQAGGSSEQCRPSAVPVADARSRLTETSADLNSSQRAAISKAYSAILLSGGHFGC